jgi:hypothetical protein
MDAANERTRLLEDDHGSPNGHFREDEFASNQNEGQDPVEVFQDKEISTTKILAIMLSVWMGTFLAALGMHDI